MGYGAKPYAEPGSRFIMAREEWLLEGESGAWGAEKRQITKRSQFWVKRFGMIGLGARTATFPVTEEGTANVRAPQRDAGMRRRAAMILYMSAF